METTDVNEWLSRAGLSFSDLGSDAASHAIRKQWREYQAAVRMCCAATRLPPDRVQLGGVYAKLRVPQVSVFTSLVSDGSQRSRLVTRRNRAGELNDE
jgi:hypothetical protein